MFPDTLTCHVNFTHVAVPSQGLLSTGVLVLMLGTDAANFDFKACLELAAGEYRISLKSKLPHLASILDGHFVAGY